MVHLSDDMVDRIQAIMKRVAKLVAGYERDLVTEGMDPDKAYDRARALEERLLDPVLDAADADRVSAYDPDAEFRKWVASN